MLKTWPHLDEVFCNLTQRDRPFFCLWLQFTNSCAKIEFFISHWNSDFVKNKTKQKQQQKNNIWQAIHNIQSKKSVNFFLFGITGKLVIET